MDINVVDYRSLILYALNDMSKQAIFLFRKNKISTSLLSPVCLSTFINPKLKIQITNQIQNPND